jgi:hypothetical protein
VGPGNPGPNVLVFAAALTRLRAEACLPRASADKGPRIHAAFSFTLCMACRPCVVGNGEGDMTVRITATIVEGQRDAAANHRALIPRIARRFPEIAKCSAFGTINVQLDQPLDRSYADFWTPQIPWIPVRLGGAKSAPRTEGFGFIRIGFECPLNGPTYMAWIILPEGAIATFCDERAEIIASEFIAGVAYGARCAIRLGHTPVLPAPSWFGETYGRSFKDGNTAT